jgi:ribosome recycling factor
MMASIIGATAARGNNASLLCQAAGRLGQFSLGGRTASSFRIRTLSSSSAATTSCQRMMSIQTVGSRAAAVTLSASTITQPTSPLNNTHTYASSGSIRLFGRKASKMGHHIESLDEMAHKDSREEARNRREEKKKKSKKARLSASKESADDDDDEAGSDDDGNDDSIENVDADGNQMLPESATVRSKMLMVIASIERSFSSIRGGEATPELFDAVRVSAYGEIVPLSSVGQVVIEDAQRATISCYDPSVANDVRDAVRDMPGLSLNPYLEEGGSGVVIIPIPRVSEETRKEIVKELGRQAENGRQRIRKIRRSAMDIVKKGKDGKLEGISKDDAFRVGKEVDSVTEEVLSVLNGIVDKKQKSVMED